MSVKKPTRREFLVAGSTAALAAAVPATNCDAAFLANAAPAAETFDRESLPFSAAELFQPGPQRTFSGDALPRSPCPSAASAQAASASTDKADCRTFPSAHGPRQPHFPQASPPTRLKLDSPSCTSKKRRPSRSSSKVPFPRSRSSTRACKGRVFAAEGPKASHASRNAISVENSLSLNFALRPVHSARRIPGCLEPIHSAR